MSHWQSVVHPVGTDTPPGLDGTMVAGIPPCVLLEPEGKTVIGDDGAAVPEPDGPSVPDAGPHRGMSQKP